MMAAVMLAMTLSACGGKPADESKPVESQPEQSQPVESQPEESQPVESQPVESQPVASSQPVESQPASSQPAESSEPAAPVKAVEVSSVDLTLKEAKAYLQIKGTATLFTQDEFKWALALMTTNNSGAASDDYILGGATFADSDYNLPATLNTDGSFLFEYNLSDIAAMKPGLFTIKAAVKGLEGTLALGDTTDGVRVKDAVNRYYIRGDVGNTNTLAVDELPPVEFTEATIIIDSEGKPWAKVGGEASVTLTDLNGYETFLGLQSTSTWSETMRTKEDGTMRWEMEGTKAYLYFDISFFGGSHYQAGNQSQAAAFGTFGYNTHLNVKANQQADLKMDVAIDEHYIVTNADGKLIDVNVLVVPGSNQQSEFWGNLGFRCNDAFEWDSAAIKTSLGEGATNTEKDFGNGVKGYKFNKADYHSTLTLTPGFTTDEDLIHANLKLLISVKLSNNEKTQFWKQIEGEPEGGTDKTSIKVGTDPTDAENFKEVTHGEEINFKQAGCTVGSGVSDTGELTVPVWIDIVDIPLTADVENTIQISYLAGGYSYYLCGARVVYHA